MQVSSAEDAYQSAGKPDTAPAEAKKLYTMAANQYTAAIKESRYVAGQVASGNIDVLLYKGLKSEYDRERQRQEAQHPAGHKKSELVMEEVVDLP